MMMMMMMMVNLIIALVCVDRSFNFIDINSPLYTKMHELIIKSE